MQNILSTILSVFSVFIYHCFLWILLISLPISTRSQSRINLVDFIFQTTINHSISMLAVIGISIAAIISGFASVHFPLEQLMLVKGIDKEIVDARLASFKQLCRGIVNRQKMLVYERRASRDGITDSLSSDFQSRHFLSLRNTDDLLDSNQQPEFYFRSCFSKLYVLFTRVLLRWKLVAARKKHSDIESDTSEQPELSKSEYSTSMCFKFLDPDSLDSDSSRADDVSFIKRNKTLIQEIMYLENLASESFLEIVYMKEITEQMVYSKTMIGKVMLIGGYVLSIYGILRFFFGFSAVFSYAYTSFAIGSNPILGAGTHGRLAVAQKADMATVLLNVIVSTTPLRVDVAFWTPVLSFILIAALAYLQIRGFIDTIQQFAKLGLSSSSSEIYALVLAHAAGCYFMACVVLLRVHLPLRFRMSVTAVLGTDIRFEFYGILYEIVFVISTLVSVYLLWIDKSRKQNFAKKRLNL